MTDSNFPCQFCSRTFPSHLSLRSHQGSQHKAFSVEIAYQARLKRNREKKKTIRPRTVPCPSCPRLFVSQTDLDKHIWWLH